MTEEDNATSLIGSVYKDVWDEFYAWEQEYCASEILALQCDAAGLDIPDDLSASSETRLSDTYNPHLYINNASVSTDSLTWEYSKEKIERRGNPASAHLIEYKTAYLKAPRLTPTPDYESCSPSKTSVFVGDDSDEMPFVPYPGSSFDFAGYRAHHNRFAWEKEHLDPDKETIILESIRRLNAYHDIPLDQIQRNLLPDVPISKLGLRDLLQWTPFQRRHDEIPVSSVLPERSDMRARFEGIVKNFCPSLNCIEAFCALHEFVPPRGPQHALRKKAHQMESSPCGPYCYMISPDSSFEGNGVEVDDAIRNIVATIRSVCPDLTTCQLAVACNRKCQETRAIQLKLHPSESGGPPKSQYGSGLEVATSSIIEKLDHFTLDYEPGLPCTHSGPCDKSSNCPCYFSGAYCERSCRCSLKCMSPTLKTTLEGRIVYGDTVDANARRQGNSTLQLAQQQLVRVLCPEENVIRGFAYHARREAGYMFFKQCIGLKINPGSPCFNSQMQRGETKKTIVKQSKYGFGLFAGQVIRKGELILEYTGEIIFESTVDSRAYFNDFRGRNYLYKLNNSVSIDSTKLGNESRFINHDRARVNCRAKYMLVNGVQRIGIYALKHLKPGTELHLDYGDEFFQNRGPA